MCVTYADSVEYGRLASAGASAMGMEREGALEAGAAHSVMAAVCLIAILGGGEPAWLVARFRKANVPMIARQRLHCS